jgi:hypothetical protein
MSKERIKRAGRLELAKRAIDLFVPHVVANGRYEAARVDMPAHWQLEAWNLVFIHAKGVLLLPTDPSMSSLLDIWSASGKKELSVSWQIERPWVPPHVANFEALGAWIPLLDLVSPIG